VKVVIPAETEQGERRVALLPDNAVALVKAGLEVEVQQGAGAACLATDSAYRQAGAVLVPDPDLAGADIVLHVRPLEPGRAALLRPGTVTLGFCSPSTETDTVRALQRARVTAFAMELVPRISRAQSMDALTSQALVAGYRCVLEAAMRLPRFFPLLMTAAGTVPPAKVLVLGAGVAGLQAIATARRLGAVVSAYDVRPASADEVRSMGATFVEIDLESLEGSGGYAREMTEDRARRQRELLTPFLTDSDVVITTAAVPGRRAPLLVTQDMLVGMRPGSVLVDLAAETGGNVEGSLPGQEIAVELAGGGTACLLGMKDAASALAADASRLYSKNVTNLLELMISDGELHLDLTDEVIAGSCLTHDGTVRHAPTARAMGEPDPDDPGEPPEGPAGSSGPDTSEKGDAR
jgi:H+-translocating NAD(P) transhydrogenase subunit alpha